MADHPQPQEVVTSDAALAELGQRAAMFAQMHGISMKKKDGTVSHAPIALLPAVFPQQLFDLACRLGPAFNVLVDRIASDHEFLCQVTESIAGADEFTGRLFAMYKAVHAEGIRQPYSLGIHRSDYMRHGASEMRQIEINTVSAGFASLGALVSEMHAHIIEHDGLSAYDKCRVVVSEGKTKAPAAMAAAVECYYETMPDPEKRAVVLFVVQPNERNMFDQWWLETVLWETHKIRTIRRTLNDVGTRASLDPATGALQIDGLSVALVYFRASYCPPDFPTETEWSARLLIERSMAIKCPTLAYHLVGTKKMQQVFSSRAVLERFFPGDAETVSGLLSVFAGLWSLQDGDVKSILAKAAARPDLYVLKPQREGGGNNLYGEDLRVAVTTWPEERLHGFVMMERVFPPRCKSLTLVDNVPARLDTLNEFGVFSAYLGRSGAAPRINESIGHLLRSKAADLNEGGVAAGYAVIDSPVLI